ncbi:hypothetical protein ABZW11_26320 [Nonomuraea sp. NPDC004580]|uniref:hypothetical protein n=1 Tax=Nonomuraea sp. NPDC004580 TaxID=3154552 RepID=UPI0033AEB291
MAVPSLASLSPHGGTIRFRAVSPLLLPLGPVSVRSCCGIISWNIDERQIDPLIGAAFASFSQSVLDGLQLPLLPGCRRPNRVRVHREHSLGGDQLIKADVSRTIDVFVPADLMTEEVAKFIGLHGTEVLRYLLATMPVLGGGWSVEP